MTVLTQRGKGANSSNGALYDAVLESGGITINQDAYTSGLDRVYDVKGLSNMVVEIQNTGGANGLTFKIEKARKEYSDITTLVDADFDEDILGDTNVAFGANSVQDIIDLSPQSTAVRIRVRRQTAGMDTTLAGFVAFN